ASVHAQRDALKTLLQGLGIRSDVLTLEVAEIFARTEKWIDAEAVHSESIANYKHAQRSLADAESSWEAWVEAHELTTQEHAKGRKNLLAYARKNLQDFQSLQQDLKHAQTTLVREQTQHDEVQAAYTELTE